ncbi:MAG: RNA-binding protein [Thermoprotei archaeon]|nr:MAG: RNA-binding protein [Thermoprotei archaeon]
MIVLPRTYICVEEEYMPSRGVYVENGKVYAAVIGRLIIDTVNRKVSVIPFKKENVPRYGDIVIGQVVSMKDEIAFIRIEAFEVSKPLKHSFTGILHISQVANEKRLPTLYDAIRTGDIIKARVINNQIPLLLSVKEPRLGVILATCSKCGALLTKRRSASQLICPNCKNSEQRKLSMDYLLIESREYNKG